jgi:hypothetical protein
MNGPTRYEQVVLSDGPVYWSLEDAIDPDTDTDRPPGMMAPQNATRDQFLARRVMVVNGHQVTVRDLIDQLAHIEGAVHGGQPRQPREELLKQVAREVYIGGLPAGVRQIQGIARIVVGGLTPLRDAVLQMSS